MRLIIDTDAGVDDAEAIMLALHHSDVTVEAITTVSGNTHVDKVVRNVFTVLDIMEADVPVYRGSDRPLVQELEHADEFHGSDGMGDMDDRQPSQRKLAEGHAALELIKRINESPDEITLIALGPLTNVALAIQLDPSLPEKIKQFYFMGGTIAAQGNAGLTSEYNIEGDPEAAFMVLRAFSHATMLSWETTVRHAFAWEKFDELTQIDTKRGRFFQSMTKKTSKFLREEIGYAGYLLPDPLTMSILMEPDLLLESETHFMTVELNGKYTRAQTVIDYYDRFGKEANVTIATKVNTDGVYELYQQMLKGGTS